MVSFFIPPTISYSVGTKGAYAISLREANYMKRKKSQLFFYKITFMKSQLAHTHNLLIIIFRMGRL